MRRFDSATEHQSRHGGNVGERQDQSADEREGHRLGHGSEHLALDARQRKDGQIHDENDDDAED